jgi:hypothetical protein
MNLDEEHGYLGGSMCSMESTARELEEEDSEGDEEEEGDE